MLIQTRMFLLVGLMLAILYGVITGIGVLTGGTGFSYVYIIIAFVFLGFQYMLGPTMVRLTMRVKYVTEKEEPDLHRMVEDLAKTAGIPKPKVGVSQLNIPNAFAYGRTIGDGHVCVTQGIKNLLSRDELKAVLAHEISHIRHRDMAIITLLSAIPLILYWIAISLLFRGMWGGGSRNNSGSIVMLIGFGAFIMYFITNLLVLYGSRIREYYADRGAVELGCRPHHLATALYKLVHGNARFKNSPELKRVEGVKAFFVNDPSRARYEIADLSSIDRDMSGAIEYDELLELHSKEVQLTTGDRLMELFTTHPNMLKRIKHLSSLAV
ncbi:MAG: zinc metalloprotease HtpX [Dehalococcoidales bacterium]|nr:zinc metalloprotease HtpX [Dehalococcoidales bacterium]